MEEKGSVLVLILFGILILAITATGVYYFSKPQAFKSLTQNQTIVPQTSKPVKTSALSSALSNETSNWKTYKNETYRFSVNYPPTAEMVINDKAGENDIAFMPQSYLTPGMYESPGLKLMVYEVDQQTADFMKSTNGAKLPKSFSGGILKEGQTLFFMVDRYKELNASCWPRGDKSVLDMCNQIISTFEFID